MNVSLTPELEKMIREKVESGMYQTASEVVREALRIMQNKGKTREERIAELQREIQIGLDDLANGRYIDITKENEKNFCESIKTHGPKRLGYNPNKLTQHTPTTC